MENIKKNPLSLQLNADDFLPASNEEKQSLVIMRESVNFWKDGLRRLKKNKIAMVSFVFIIAIAIFAYLLPAVWPYSYAEQVKGSNNLAPFEYSASEQARIDAGEKVFPHILGTDRMGRDFAVRIMMGTRVSLSVGLIASGLVLIIGATYGAVSAFAGGGVDNIMMRITDILYTIPDILLIILLSMATFRSPAVALMPDVTPKPLRSKANAVINLMGSAGGIIVLALGMVFATASVSNSKMGYPGYFGVIAALMLAALVEFMLTVREPEWARERQAQAVAAGIEDAEETDHPNAGRKLSADEVKSLLLILLSIVLWFFGYNAVTSKYSVYASNILHKDYNLTLIIAQAAAIAAYLPVGFIAGKIGRKKTILAGVVMLTVAFGVAGFLTADSPAALMNAMFALAGIAWATINVNSFPMVVELCSGGDVGKYTGFYYTASMAAQVATPMLSGLLMDRFGMHVLFPYAAVFTTLAFVTMLFVRHGDSKPQAKIGLEALDEMED